MRRAIGYRIFGGILILSILFISLLFIFNYRTVKSALLNQYLTDAEVEKTHLVDTMNHELSGLRDSIVYLGKDLSYDIEKDIYLIQDFQRNTVGIEAIYIFDDNRQLVGEIGDQHVYKGIISEEIGDRFFYTPITWDQVDTEDYFVYHKLDGNTNYMALVLDLPSFFNSTLVERLDHVALINSYGHIVAESQNNSIQAITELEFSGTLLEGHTKTEFYNGDFYSYGSVGFDDIDLMILTKESGQAYNGSVRQYLVRNVALALFLMTISVLLSWRLIKSIYNIYLRQVIGKHYQVQELDDIRLELNKGVLWIEDVVLHYDELNRLKEELNVLIKKLPQEGEVNEKDTQ